VAFFFLLLMVLMKLTLTV